jgi:hypothetical protein
MSKPDIVLHCPVEMNENILDQRVLRSEAKLVQSGGPVRLFRHASWTTAARFGLRGIGPVLWHAMPIDGGR